MASTFNQGNLAAAPARLLLAAVLAALSAASLTGCFAVAASGVAVGTFALLDRRTFGAQTDDQGIELKAISRLQEVSKAGGVSVTSFNRNVLLTGFVLDEAARREVEAVVAKIENVRSVQNELLIGARPSIGTATSDSALTARIKAAFVEAHDLQTNAFKVVTESGTAYLMGLVTRREGERAAQVTSRVSGVQKVVTVFQYISEEDVTRISGGTGDSKGDSKK